MELLIIILGVAVAGFVGINIGGSSTGVAFGPSVGSNIISKVTAGVLMTFFAFLGGWTVGRNVITTMGGEIVSASLFSLEASVAVLFFVGLMLMVSNLFGVPSSTSMTAVASIVGMGMAAGDVDWAVLGRIVSWWFAAPVVGFFVGAVLGRYIYPYLDTYFDIEASDERLVTWKRDGKLIYPVLNGDRGQIIGSSLVLIIACYMAFSAGASNVANAVAPLVGSGQVSMNIGIFLAGIAISIGAFSIARKTMDTVGNDLTDLPVLAAVLVALTASTVTTILSWMGIPISLALTSLMCIVGLGWGRATRTVKITDIKEEQPRMTVNSLNVDQEDVKKIGEESEEELLDAEDLFKPEAVSRVVVLWIITPSTAVTLSYLFFTIFPIF